MELKREFIATAKVNDIFNYENYLIVTVKSLHFLYLFSFDNTEFQSFPLII